MARAEIEKLQLERLKWVVDYAYRNIPLYKEKYDKAGVSADKIKSLDDVKHLPFTTKEDLRDNYPLKMAAVPRSEIVRIHGTSGTTGKPTLVGYTRNDLNIWADLIARLATAVGVTRDDVAQMAFGYGLFTGGFGLHYGLEKIGCMIVPLAAGNTERHIYMMQDLQTTVLIATPSYALYLSESIREKGIDKNSLALKVGLFGGEGCTKEMRETIEKNLGIIATDNYGMCELGGPGVSGECVERNGLHIAEDHFLPELINPETLERVAPGEKGEMVLTSLTREGFPIIRYRTKDITRLNYEPCVCGRTHVRMDKVTGRSDDMIIIKGVNVFPSQIESVIIGMENIAPFYQLVVRREGFKDTLEVEVEIADSIDLENWQELAATQNNIKVKLHSVLGLDAKVRLVESKSLPRTEGKSKRVIDLRPKD